MKELSKDKKRLIDQAFADKDVSIFEFFEVLFGIVRDELLEIRWGMIEYIVFEKRRNFDEGFVPCNCLGSLVRCPVCSICEDIQQNKISEWINLRGKMISDIVFYYSDFRPDITQYLMDEEMVVIFGTAIMTAWYIEDTFKK